MNELPYEEAKALAASRGITMMVPDATYARWDRVFTHADGRWIVVTGAPDEPAVVPDPPSGERWTELFTTLVALGRSIDITEEITP